MKDRIHSFIYRFLLLKAKNLTNPNRLFSETENFGFGLKTFLNYEKFELLKIWKNLQKKHIFALKMLLIK